MSVSVRIARGQITGPEGNKHLTAVRAHFLPGGGRETSLRFSLGKNKHKTNKPTFKIMQIAPDLHKVFYSLFFSVFSVAAIGDGSRRKSGLHKKDFQFDVDSN